MFRRKLGMKSFGKLLGSQLIETQVLMVMLSPHSKKARRKLGTLGSLEKIFNLEQRRNLMKALIESQFSHWPLVSNNRINHVH